MIFVAFIVMLLLAFGVMVFATKPSQGQQVLERRMAEIQSKADSTSTNTQVAQLLKLEPTSQFGWLEGLLQKYQISQMLETRIAQADSKTTVSRLVMTSVVLGVVGCVISFLIIPMWIVQVLATLILAYIPIGLISFKRSRRLKAFAKGLPDSIDMMGRALRAGHSMVAAMSIIAEQGVEPIASEFNEVFKQQNFGLPLRDALNQMLDRVPSADLRVLVTGILVQKDTGGNLAEILDRIGHTIRERMRIHGEIKTHTAQGRMTGYILCALPIVMLVVINLVNPGYSKVLIDTPLGHEIGYVGIGLLTVGGLIIRQIINGIEV